MKHALSLESGQLFVDQYSMTIYAVIAVIFMLCTLFWYHRFFKIERRAVSWFIFIILSTVLISSAYAADTQLSLLGELATTPSASDEFYVNDGGVSKKIQYSNLGFEGTLTNEVGLYSALSDVADFVQADEANSIDSVMYVDGSIDLAHMSSASVDSDNIVNATIAVGDMAVNSIDSDQYVDGSIDEEHIADDAINDDSVNWSSIENLINVPIIKPNDVDNKGSMLVWFNSLRAMVVTSITGRSTEDDSTAELFAVGGDASGNINWDDLHVIEPLNMSDDNTGGVNWFSTRVTTNINWSAIELYDTVGINWTSGTPDESIFTFKVRGE